MDISIHINAPEIAAALQELAAAIKGKQPAAVTNFNPPETASPVTAPPAPPAAMPVTIPAVQPPAAPVQQVQTPPVQTAVTAVPTSAPTYGLNQLIAAATPLIDAGRQAELVNLLTGFGVQSLTSLPPEKYGEFATALRGLGAKI